jgi:uncharacterized protein YyaL (SSP411 family)
MMIPLRRFVWIFALVAAWSSLSCLEATADEKSKATTSAKAAEPPRANHLAGETSPYLLQHAHNPVDWRPWGPEALAKAKEEGKIIFLSIGYSSCHWCHVMERESFTDAEIARVLNENFICIKVDREERPDVDNIYMTSLQIYNQLNGAGRGGGWPLSMFLTPEAEPFFGGTYFPARDGDREGITGFLTLLAKVREVWAKSPDRVREDAKTLTGFVKRELEGRRLLALKKIDGKLLDGVQAALDEQFDAQWGGFGYSDDNPRQPKFPEPSNLVFLIDRLQRGEDEQARKILIVTLDKMARGGIRDHIGGGFHRYSTDRMWRIPHFEKMLYDNGQLLSVYAEAYQLTGRKDFAEVARETADFVLREMTDPAGGFYAAIDAESDGEEGKFYRWTKEEARQTLTEDEFEQFAAAYGFDGKPNFEEHYVPQLSADSKLPEDWSTIRRKLLGARNARPRPKTDTKILTADNGLMITGLADAGRILKEPRYLQAAEKGANFVLENLRTSDGRLLRTYGGGKAKLNAYATDYAFFIEGLLALHRATGERRWLDAADPLMKQQIELFHDEKVGDFFFTSDDHETLLARIKDPIDNAQPAANSVSAANLLRLAKELQLAEYLKLAEQTVEASAGLLEASPYSAPRMATNIPALEEVRQTLMQPRAQ